MKKTLILATILMLTGCSSKVKIENISKQERIMGIVKLDKKVFTDRVSLEKAILGLKFLSTSKKIIWKKRLKDIDFSKNNILVYSFDKCGICGYQEKFIQKSTTQADIIFRFKPKGICIHIEGYYTNVYKVSKDIKKVGVKSCDKGYVVVEMK